MNGVPTWTGVQHLPRNPGGRDLVVADLHGMRPLLEHELERLRFDPARDRVICVGDLVDRGAHSVETLRLLDEPWFHSVLGNHDFAAAVMCLGSAAPVSAYAYGDFRILPEQWLKALGAAGERELLNLVSRMPFAIEIDTSAGAVGIVHAEVPSGFASWRAFTHWIESRIEIEARLDWCWPLLWGRSFSDTDGGEHRAGQASSATLSDIHHVLHGHTITASGRQPRRCGNRYHIDQGAYLEMDSPTGRERGAKSRLTIVDAQQPKETL